MAELTFVGLGVLVWTFAFMIVLATLGSVVLVAHIIRIEILYYQRKWGVKKARREMLERQARIRRAKERQAKDEKFFADIDGIIHGL